MSGSNSLRSLLLLALVLCTWPAFADDPADLLSDFESPATPFVPRTSRSEEEQDRIVSAALYAHGRVLYQRREFSAALARFQRAWRYNPDAVSILPEIISLANHLRRQDEAARYAAIAPDHADIDLLVLRRLALLQSAKRDGDMALRLFEKAWQLQQARGTTHALEDVGLVLQFQEMGRLYFEAGSYAEAHQMLSRVSQAIANPDQLSENETLRRMVLRQADATREMLAECLVELGKADEAEKLIRQLYSDDQQAAELEYQLARIDDRRGATDAAIDRLQKYFQSGATAAESRPYELFRKQLEKKLRDPSKALAEATEVLEARLAQDTANLPLAGFVARLRLQQQQWQRAAELYERLAAERPSVEAYEGLLVCQFRLADERGFLETLGKSVERSGGLDDFDEVEKLLDGDAPFVGRVIAGVEAEIADRPEEISPRAALAGAWLALRQKQYETADRIFDFAFGRQGDAASQTALSWGIEMLLAGQYDRSTNVFRQALARKQSDDETAPLRLYLIRSLAMAGKTQEALEAAETAAKMWPKSPRFQSQPAWVHYYAKNNDQAVTAYRAVLDEFDEDYSSAGLRNEMRDIRLILSNLATRQDKMADAEEWLEQVLDEFPEDVGAQNDLGYLWTEQGKRLRRALRMIQNAVAAEPDNVAYIDSLGWAYFRLKQYDKAVEQLERATAGDDPDGVILDHLGDAYFEQDKIEKALAAWRRAKAAFEKEQDSKRLEAVLRKIEKHE